jgi:hypothetical protein
VPLIVVLAIRVYRAFAATFNLLTDRALLRTLPWRYIVRLPLRHAWMAIAAASLVVTLAAAAAALVVPQEASDVALQIGWIAALTGLGSSWVRAVLAWRRLRGR